jgi:hypothetical protein
MVGVDAGNVMGQVGVCCLPDWTLMSVTVYSMQKQGTEIKLPLFRVYYPNCMPNQASNI